MGVYWRGKWAWGRKRIKGDEIRKPLRTTHAREAQSRYEQWVGGLSTSEWDKAETTFELACDTFMDEHMPILKQSSYKRYMLSLLTMRPFFEGKTLQGISRVDLSSFVSARRKQGVTSGTIRRDLACLSSVYTTADDFEMCDTNPVPSFLRQQKRRGLKEAPPRTRHLSHDEEDRILLHAKQRIDACLNRPRTALTRTMILAAIALSIDIGLRDEELLRLPWDDVDFDRCQITIPKERSKSGVERKVPLLPRAVQILRVACRGIPNSSWCCGTDMGRASTTSTTPCKSSARM